MIVDCYGASQFSADVLRRWGSTVPELGDNPGALHSQIGALATAVRRSCQGGDPLLGIAILRFLGDVLNRNGRLPELDNAIAISFLDYKELGAYGLLSVTPPAVHDLLVEQAERWARTRDAAANGGIPAPGTEGDDVTTG